MSLSQKEKDSILDLLQYANDKVIVFDVGSNKGQWSDIIINRRDESILAGQYKVHLFEPNELLLNYTRVKYEYNKNIRYVNKAAYSKHEEIIPFYYFTNENNGLSSIYHNPKWDYLPMIHGKTGTITLDKYAEENEISEIDFIKIDTEGSEYDVLIGCLDLLQNKKVKFIQVEYSEHYKLTNTTFSSVISYFEKHGYSCHEWDGEYFKKVSKDDFTEDYRLDNFIFTYLPITRYHYTQPTWNKEFIKNTQGLGKFNLVLEIGCFEGLTTNYICDNLLNENGRIICVDPLQDKYLVNNLSEADEKTNEELTYFHGQYDRFIRNTKGKPVELVRKRSTDAFDYLRQYLFDFAYIDGDHREIYVLLDAINTFYFLKIGGYMLLDDYGWSEETKSGIDRFLEDFKDRIEVIIKDYQVLIKKIAA